MCDVLMCFFFFILHFSKTTHSRTIGNMSPNNMSACYTLLLDRNVCQLTTICFAELVPSRFEVLKKYYWLCGCLHLLSGVCPDVSSCVEVYDVGRERL